MALCDFGEDGAAAVYETRRRVVCRVCGRASAARVFPLRVACGGARAVSAGRGGAGAGRVAACVHRGAEIGRAECAACGGRRVELKLLACGLHGRCTVARPVDGAACCAGCPDYVAAGASGDADADAEGLAPGGVAGEVASVPYLGPGRGVATFGVAEATFGVAEATFGVAARAGAARRPVRVGFLTPALCVGGIEQWLAALCRWLDPQAVEVSGIGVADHGPTDDRTVAALGRHCPIVGSWRLESHGRNAQRGIVRLPDGDAAASAVADGADILVTWGVRGRAPVPDRFGGPVVVVSHGNCTWTRESLAASLPYVSHLAAVSESARASYPQVLQPDVAVIWNGIELDRVAAVRDPMDVRRELRIAPGERMVLFVGRFAADKRPELAARIVAGTDDLVAVFVGNGWDEVRFRRRIEREAEGRCRFVAPPWNLGDFYGAADVLVCSSPAEGFGLVIAEAWAARLPVVCGDVGIVPEAERIAGPCRWAVPVDADVAAWRAAVREASLSRFSGRVLAAWGLTVERLTAAAMADRWAYYLRSVAGG